MRSLIKSHRRSDSSTSDAASELPRPRPSKTTPLNSPVIPHHAANLTPPLLSGSLNATIASPKKLLTPIKKMFGHHSKSNVSNVSPGVITTGDSLNAAVSSTFEPPKGRRKHIKFASSASLSDLQKGHIMPAANKQLATSALMEMIRGSLSESLPLPPPRLAALSRFSDSSVETRKNEVMPIVFDKGLGLPMNHDSGSLLSIANSEGNFRAKQALSQEILAESSLRADTEAYYEDDDDLRDSDASSQFSFVKDIRGGRNTSVKYYKTKPSCKSTGPTKAGFLQADIMGYDEAGLSDYDFDNNGMDDDDGLEDGGYDDFEGTNRYHDFLDDNEGTVPTQSSSLDERNELDYENDKSEDYENGQPDDYDNVHSDDYENADDYENDQSDVYEAGQFDNNEPDDYDEIVQHDEADSGALNPDTSHPLSDAASGSGPELPLFSFSQSREGTPELRFGVPQDLTTPGQVLTEDLLDSYLQFETPSTAGANARSPFELFASDSASPLINGITIGSEQKFRSQRISRNTPSDQPKNDVAEKLESKADISRNSSIGLGIASLTNKRRSIANMMDLLGSLEEASARDQAQKDLEEMKSLFEQLDKQNETKKPAKRSLVINMMNTLATLENALTAPTEELKKKARNSIADMMKTLAALEIQQDEKPPSPHEPEITQLPRRSSASSLGEKQRYSWLSNGEFPKTKHDNLAADQGNAQLEEDLLDEVNQLPEDFDFEDQEIHYESNLVPDFYRSNSYNKKPQKAVVDNSYQKNKIETSQKTVTFYRSSSLRVSENLSRAGSVMSSNSFHSFNEEEEEDESQEREGVPRKHLPYSIHHNSHIFEVSNDASSRKSFILEPITESESPHIK